MDYLQCQANSCTNGSHKQLRCSGFHRSRLTNSWRCPPHGAPARLTEHQPRQPSGPAANSQFALVSDPSHVQPSHVAAAICTDSQSLLKAIQSGSANTADLRSMLNKRAEKTTLVWIPGHHGIADNEEVDASAKQAVPTVFTDQSPSPQPVHSSAEL